MTDGPPPAALPADDAAPIAAATVRVALVDDHVLLAHALGESLSLDAGVDVVLVHDGGEGVVEAVATAGPDVLLLDIGLAGRDGLSLISDLHRVSPHLGVVVLSGDDEPHTVARALQMGAVGFVGKGAPLREVRRAVTAVGTGAVVLPQNRLSATLRRLSSPHHEARRLGAYLTAREREVLERLVQGRSTPAISEELHITQHTARTHIQNILIKLGAHSRLEAAAMAVRAGLVEGRGGRWTDDAGRT